MDSFFERGGRKGRISVHVETCIAPEQEKKGRSYMMVHGW